jgi:hypothetical protein
MNNSTRKQIAALKAGIEALRDERRRNYASGEHAYQNGMRKDTLKSEGVEGELFMFAEDGHKNYVLISEHIKQLEDLIDIVSDPGVVHEQERLL